MQSDFKPQIPTVLTSSIQLLLKCLLAMDATGHHLKEVN
jgi:hypothetical protein